MAKPKKKSNIVLKPRRSTRNLNTPQIREKLIDLISEESIQNNEEVQQELLVDERVDNFETENMDDQIQDNMTEASGQSPLLNNVDQELENLNVMQTNSNQLELNNILAQLNHNLTRNTSHNIPFSQLLPTYFGNPEENFNFFITTFNQICDKAQWQENQKVRCLKMQLKGKAQQYLSQNDNIATEIQYNKLEKN